MSESGQNIHNRLLLARLPALPQILVKLMALFQTDEAGMAELARLIANDAALSTKVLTAVNSAAYYQGRRKVGLIHALTMLGADMVKALVLSESVFQTFNSFSHAGSVDLRNFWKHSLTVAVMAREIAKKVAYAQVEEAYLAGLLHDGGRLALLAAAPSQYSAYFEAEDSQQLCDAEQQLLQISHAEAGAWLVERWQLDTFLADAILYHHESAERLTGTHALIRIVRLAQQLGEMEATETLTDDVGAICNLSASDLQPIVAAAEAQVMKAAQFLGVDIAALEKPLAVVPPPFRAPKQDPAQSLLAEEVRNRSLLAEFGQLLTQQANDMQMLALVRQNAQIFFGLDNTVVMLLNSSGQALVGVSYGERHQRLAELQISLSGNGVIAASALRRAPVFLSADGGPYSIAEQQLLRVFAADCLLCLPMIGAGHCLGMVVSGIPQWRMTELNNQQNFLQAFANQAANALAASANERGAADQRIAELQQEQRISSRRVAHEVNNPLGLMKNYLSVLDDKLTRQESVHDEISILNEEIDHISNIIGEFAGITTKTPTQVTDINHIITDLVHLFQQSRFMPASVQIESQVTSQTNEISGSANSVKQVLVNLIKNAIEAMPLGGQIVVQNKGLVRRENRVFFEVCVQDSGTGIAAEIMANLYTSGASTKSGENRGLGLGVVANLVKRLNGFINCHSTGSGTTFEILFPAAPTAARVATPALAKDVA